MSTLYIRNAANDGWIELLTSVTPPPPDITATFNSDGGTPTYNSQTGPSPLNVLNPGTPTKANNTFNGWSPSLPTTITNNTTFTAQWIADPTSISLAQNDIDFFYKEISASGTEAFLRFQGIIDTTNFFSNGGDHAILAINAEGGQGSNNPHCGPIIRNGENLWQDARGFIIFANGAIWAEQWNGTSSPGFLTITNQSGNTYNPAVNPVVHFRIDGWFRTGTLANNMYITLRANSSGGAILFQGVAPGWGWDPSTSYRAAIGGIAAGFVAPSATGCVEELLPRSAPSASFTFSNLSLSAVG